MALLLASCSTPEVNDILVLVEGNYDKDRLLYQKNIEKYGYKELYYNLAFLELEQGNFEAAVEVAEEALELYPDYLRLDFLELYAYREMGEDDLYFSKLSEIHATIPADEEINKLYLASLEERGMKSEADELAFYMLALDWEDRTAIAHLAESHPFFETLLDDTEETDTVFPRLRTVQDLTPLEKKSFLNARYAITHVNGKMEEKSEESTFPSVPPFLRRSPLDPRFIPLASSTYSIFPY